MQTSLNTSHERPRFVRGLDMRPVYPDDLPKPGIKRWYGHHKSVVLAAVRGGLITPEEAWDRYGLTDSELKLWYAQFERHGIQGLCFPRGKVGRGAPVRRGRRKKNWAARLADELPKKSGILIVDPVLRQISCGSTSLKIREMQMMILLEIMKHPDSIVSKQMLLEAIWTDQGYMPTHKVLDVGMCHLRKQLRALTGQDWIETVWGRGYQWKEAKA